MESIDISTNNAKTEYNNLLRYRFKEPTHLNGQIRLSSAYMWYNWKNISSKLNNNQYSFNGVGVTIPDGSYNVSDLNNFIKYKYKQKTGKELSYDVLKANSVYNRITLTVSSGHTFSLQGNLSYTLGASSKKNDITNYTYTNTNINLPHVPHIENVESVQIHCNLVYNKLQAESRLLYSFTPSKSYGSLIFLEPRELWKNTRRAVEREIEIYLTDQNGIALDIEDNIQFTVVIKYDEES